MKGLKALYPFTVQAIVFSELRKLAYCGNLCNSGSSCLSNQESQRVFFTKRSSKVQDYKGETWPSVHPLCFLLSEVHVLSLLPTVAILKPVMFCFVF